MSITLNLLTLKFTLFLFLGRVRELLIISEKTSTTPAFGVNAKRSSCSRFSVTYGHGLFIIVR